MSSVFSFHDEHGELIVHYTNAIPWTIIINRTIEELDIMLHIESCRLETVHIGTIYYRACVQSIHRIETAMLNLYNTTEGEQYEIIN